MSKTLNIAIRFTIVTTVLLGILYPLAITAFAHLALRSKADGQLIDSQGKTIGSHIIGQSFSNDKYFHGRPSAAGNGYDATASSGSNYAQSNQKLITRIQDDVATYARQSDGRAVPIDLVTASGSGLDPDISPESAYFQTERVAKSRNLSEKTIHDLVTAHIQSRQFGVLGEPRVNVLELNMALDQLH